MTYPLSKLLNHISSKQQVSLKSESIKLPDNLPITSTDVLNSVKKNNALITEIIEKKIVNIDYSKIRLKAINNRGTSEAFSIGDGEVYDKIDHDADLSRYKVENLNVEQRQIWDYMNKNRTKIVLIQAGPGCGKSYTLKTIAYNMKNVKFDTIIYKLDLLAAFKYNSRRFTVAKFVMHMLGLGFYQYQALDKLLSSKITSYEFMLVIISMIKRATLPNMKGGIVFLDEYTIVSKPILLVTLMLLEYHQIGAIICGDRNQLQNIFNSKHATLSSYKLAASFASKQFHLHVNERCSDEEYNAIINYISQFSNSKKLDAYAYAMVSAIFLRQLIEPPKYHQVHLAGTHQELSNLAHTLVCNNKYKTDFYTIDQSKLRDKDFVIQSKPTLQPTQALLDYMSRIQNNEPPRVDKFLPYLPLVIGARYYVFKHSEYSQGILRNINPDGTLLIDMDNGQSIIVGRNTNDNAIFDEHKKFLLNGELGKLYSYPIYPSEFMSIHMCQGCTIIDNLDLMLNNTQYQGLYVALSRVTTPNQISRVTIPDQISYIVSSIINFPKHMENKPINVDDLKRGMENYVFYNVNRNIEPFLPLIHDFILNTNAEYKKILREKIILLTKECHQTRVTMDTSSNDESSNLLTMSLIIKYRDIFLALACLDELDRNVWLHEYILSNSELSCLLPSDFIPNSMKINQFEIKELNELVKLADLNYTYKMEMSTIEYIESKSKSSIRMNDDDKVKHQKFVIKEQSDYVFSETTEFCAKVYKQLISGEKITSEWLIDELNYMIGVFGNTTTEQPKKKKIKHDFIKKFNSKRLKL